MKIKRIYHNYKNWEEYKNGMWRTIKDEEEKEKLLQEAIRFTGNHQLYGEYMMKVIKEWKISCEHNLTDTSLNRQAWIGHSACCLAIGCPEDITREAWWKLTDDQRDLANKEADKAINKWEENHRRKKYAQTTIRLSCIRSM